MSELPDADDDDATCRPAPAGADVLVVGEVWGQSAEDGIALTDDSEEWADPGVRCRHDGAGGLTISMAICGTPLRPALSPSTLLTTRV